MADSAHQTVDPMGLLLVHKAAILACVGKYHLNIVGSNGKGGETGWRLRQRSLVQLVFPVVPGRRLVFSVRALRSLALAR